MTDEQKKDSNLENNLDAKNEQNTISSGIVEQRLHRVEKLKNLEKAGFSPFPATANRTHKISEVLADFDQLDNHGTMITIAGRIKFIRNIGKLAFVILKDQSGQIQTIFETKTLGEADTKTQKMGFKEFKEFLDLDDIIEVTGRVTITRTGEKSIMANSVRLLTKSIRPLPDKLEDKGERARKRYVDIALNDDVKARFERRAKYWQAHRDFLNENGFLEMNIPVLEHTTGGADANPFITHMDALDEDFYLRISQELYLKRLIGAGYEKVYEIGPRFRNEGMSEEHLPEHIAMEFYWAYTDYKDGMKFVQELFRYVADKTWGTQKFKIRGFNVDLSKDWQVIDFCQIIKERYGVDVFNTNIEEIKEKLTKEKIDFDPKTINISRGVDALWKTIRKTIGGPTFMVHEPVFLSPLSKRDDEKPQIAQRFHPVIGGSELGNGFSELNDPIDQLNRFKEQQKMRESGDTEAHMLDIDFIEMLEYGMPPTFGWGNSERNFWYFENVTAREGVPFPQMRRYLDPVNTKIYPDLNLNSEMKNIKKLPPI